MTESLLVEYGIMGIVIVGLGYTVLALAKQIKEDKKIQLEMTEKMVIALEQNKSKLEANTEAIKDLTMEVRK